MLDTHILNFHNAIVWDDTNMGIGTNRGRAESSRTSSNLEQPQAQTYYLYSSVIYAFTRK